jgi:hypothetical protein
VGGHAVSVTPDCGCKVPASGSADDAIEGLRRAMAAYAGDPARIDAHGANARHRVESVYGWPGKAERMAGIYQEALRRAATPHAGNAPG